jgi:NitT/TauT family transport system substrate-binding protein
MKRTIAGIIATVIASAALGACGASGDKDAGGGATTIRLAAATASTTSWGGYAADDLGLFEKAGLSVQPTYVGSVQNAAQQVIGGSYDIGIVNLDATIAAIDAGAPLVAIGSPMIKAPFRLMVNKDVTGAQDFVGKTVSMASTKDPDTYLFRQWLRDGGVDDGKVTFVYSGTSTARYAALAGGQAVGALLIAPYDTQAIRDGYKPLLNMAEVHAGQNFGFLGFVVRKDWLADHGDVAKKFLKAFADGNDWIQDPANKDKAISILAKHVKVDEETASAIYDYYMNELKPYSKNAELPPSWVEGAMKIISKTVGTDFTGVTPDKYLATGYTPQS